MSKNKKDNSMNDEEWNAWTADVRTFLDEKLEASREQAETIGMEQEEFDDYLEYVERELASGDNRAYKRQICKGIIQQNGRELPFWPKQRGMSNTNWHTSETAAMDNRSIVMNEAYSSMWDVLAGNNSLELDFTHTIIQRASKKRGDGVAFANKEAFVDANVKSEASKAKTARQNGHWGITAVGEPFDITSAWIVPYTGSSSEETDGESDDSSDN